MLAGRAVLAVLALVAACSLAACTEPAPRAPDRPMIVFGIDGAEWTVIERLWDRGELPVLRALAERGTRATLATDYGMSPVIWTTIATGRRPREHGITDFVRPTARGDVTVSSDHRRVPALWNMLSAAGRPVAVLGWWASWPAEEVEGVVVSDRVLRESERQTFPAALEADLARLHGEPDDGAGWDMTDHIHRRDRVMAGFGRELAPRDFDLMMVYFRSTDVESHRFWRYWEPERFAPLDAAPSDAELAALADRIPRAYRAVDRAIGEVVAAAPAATNVLVVSDHGFRAAPSERTRIVFDLDVVLERLGFLARSDAGVDVAASQVYTYASPTARPVKLVRFGDSVPPRQRPAVRDRLGKELARVTWAGGEPVFDVRDAGEPERSARGDLVVEVRGAGATDEVLLDGRRFVASASGPTGFDAAGPVQFIRRVSGTHNSATAGILIAAGPDFQPGAEVGGISIHDLAPTILYGLGLPVAEDFAGRAWTELYTEEFRRRHPLTTIATWGTREAGETARSKADEELVQELRALGYLD